MTVETELQERLARLAERTAPPPRESLARTVVATHRARRRQAVGLTSLVAVVAALVVLSTTTLGGQSDTTAATATVGDPAGPNAATAAPVDVLAGPTRGSLAGDAAFLEAVRQLPWTSDVAGSDVPDAPVESRRVVFAGDVGASRLVVVAGANTVEPVVTDPELQTDLGALSDVATAWFVGPVGAAPEQLELQSVPRGTTVDQPLAALDPTTGALVVLTAPGDEVSISLRPEITADGSAVREYQGLDARDGVATAVLPAGSTSAQALRGQVVRASGTMPLLTQEFGSGRAEPDVPVTWLRPAPAPSPVDIMTGVDAGQVLSQLGLTTADVAFSGLWAGDVPSPARSGTSQVRLLAARLPSGAVFLHASLGVVLGDTVGGTWCGQGIQPAGTPVAERTVVVRCDATDMSTNSDTVSSLVVVGPATATSARAVDADGEVLDEFPLTDGVAVVPFHQRTAAVQTLAPDGTVLATESPLTTADLGD